MHDHTDLNTMNSRTGHTVSVTEILPHVLAALRLPSHLTNTSELMAMSNDRQEQQGEHKHENDHLSTGTSQNLEQAGAGKKKPDVSGEPEQEPGRPAAKPDKNP